MLASPHLLLFTAILGEDYSLNTTTLTLEVGEDEACLLTTILPDNVYELTEELTLTISSVTPDIDVNDTSISLLTMDSPEGIQKQTNSCTSFFNKHIYVVSLYTVESLNDSAISYN